MKTTDCFWYLSTSVVDKERYRSLLIMKLTAACLLLLSYELSFGANISFRGIAEGSHTYSPISGGTNSSGGGGIGSFAVNANQLSTNGGVISIIDTPKTTNLTDRGTIDAQNITVHNSFLMDNAEIVSGPFVFDFLAGPAYLYIDASHQLTTNNPSFSLTPWTSDINAQIHSLTNLAGLNFTNNLSGSGTNLAIDANGNVIKTSGSAFGLITAVDASQLVVNSGTARIISGSLQTNNTFYDTTLGGIIFRGRSNSTGGLRVFFDSTFADNGELPNVIMLSFSNHTAGGFGFAANTNFFQIAATDGSGTPTSDSGGPDANSILWANRTGRAFTLGGKAYNFITNNASVVVNTNLLIGNGNGITIISNDGTSLSIQTSNSTASKIYQTTTGVGIGTNNPSVPFEVVGQSIITLPTSGHVDIRDSNGVVFATFLTAGTRALTLGSGSIQGALNTVNSVGATAVSVIGGSGVLASSGNSFSFDDNTSLSGKGNSGMFSTSIGTITLKTNVLVTGSVGIGTTTPTNALQVVGIAQANGFSSYVSNKLAITLVTLPASPSLWTNTFSFNVTVGWVGAAVTGVSINSSFWPTALTGGSVSLQPGEWVGFTNSVVPTFGWKPL